jgi:hypothetical protein
MTSPPYHAVAGSLLHVRARGGGIPSSPTVCGGGLLPSHGVAPPPWRSAPPLPLRDLAPAARGRLDPAAAQPERLDPVHPPPLLHHGGELPPYGWGVRIRRALLLLMAAVACSHSTIFKCDQRGRMQR